ncbi:hypothetical protein ACE1BH_24990, partial [Aeromonas jandaei]
KRRAHDADLKGMVVIRSPNFQLVPFKLHRFGQQRPIRSFSQWPNASKCVAILATENAKQSIWIRFSNKSSQ